MWLITETGFISLVQDRKDPSKVWVRARIKEDIANAFPNQAEQIETKIGADYIYRLLIPKEVAATVLWNQVMDINYDSHAKEVMNRRSHSNPKRMGAYYAIWRELALLQPYAPYAKTPRPAGGYVPKTAAKPGMTSTGWKTDLYKGVARGEGTTFQNGLPYDWSQHPQSKTFVEPDDLEWPGTESAVVNTIHDGEPADEEIIGFTDEEWQQYVAVRESEHRGPGNRRQRRARNRRKAGKK